MSKSNKRSAARASKGIAGAGSHAAEPEHGKHEQPTLEAGSPWRMDIRELVRRNRYALLLIVLALVAYFPTLGGAYTWDDDQHLMGNEAVQTWGGLWRIWTDFSSSPNYYPLSSTSLWVEHKLWGIGTPDSMGILRPPVGYHLTNILLQAVAAMGLYAVLVKLKLRGGAAAAWLAAAIWLVHPVNVESVAWLAERKNVLSAALFFPALYMFLRAFGVIHEERKTEARSDWAWAYGLFVAALLSKTVTCVMPAVVLAIVWWKNGRITGRDWMRALPMLVVGLGLAAFAVYVESSGQVGAAGAAWEFTLGQRVLIAGNALWFYVGKVLWPYPLVMIFPRWDVQVTNTALWVGPIAWIAMVGILAGLSKKISRGPATAAIVFTVILSPALGFINFYTMLFSFVADHYQHIASAVVIVAVVEVVLLAARRLGGALRYPAIAKGFGAAVLVVLTGLTLFYGKKWQDPEELWAFTVKHNPTGYYPRINLATALMQKRKFAEAEAQLVESVKLNPKDWRHYEALMAIYLVRNDFAMVKLMMALADAEMPEQVRKTRERVWKEKQGAVSNPDRLQLFPELELAMQLERQGRFVEAREAYLAAMKKRPEDAGAYVGLGNFAVWKDDLAGAEKWYREALAKDPNHARALLFLGGVLRATGREEEGVKAILKAAEIAPDMLERDPSLLRGLMAPTTQGTTRAASGPATRPTTKVK